MSDVPRTAVLREFIKILGGIVVAFGVAALLLGVAFMTGVVMEWVLVDYLQIMTQAEFHQDGETVWAGYVFPGLVFWFTTIVLIAIILMMWDMAKQRAKARLGAEA